jgi:NAD-dependent aldehyde dehydrogenases
MAFIGSPEIGRLVGVAAANSLTPLILELGGKSPNVVFPDADLDLAVPIIANAILQNAGQTCSAASRLLVHSDVHDDVVGRLTDIFESQTLGPGVDDPDMGPLISGRQRDRVAEAVAQASSDGLVVTGGRAPQHLDRGFFFEPTLLDRVSPSCRAAQEEIFGPVLTVSVFDSVEDVVPMANSTAFGLVAAIWTDDIRIAHRFARDVRAGQVFVNSYGVGGGVELPFGGSGMSGYGREKGTAALLAYTQLKTVVVRL